MKIHPLLPALLLASTLPLAAQNRPVAAPLAPTVVSQPAIVRPALGAPGIAPGFFGGGAEPGFVPPGQPGQDEPMPFDPGIEFPQPGRYTLITSQIQPAGKAQPQTVVLKLDTSTGQVWVLQAEDVPARGNLPASTVLKFVAVIDQQAPGQPAGGFVPPPGGGFAPPGGFGGGGIGGGVVPQPFPLPDRAPRPPQTAPAPPTPRL